MDFVKGDFIYGLNVYSAGKVKNKIDIIYRSKATGLIVGEVTSIYNNNCQQSIYFYEGVLLKFKNCIDNNLKPSNKEISGFLNFLRNEFISSISFRTLKNLIPDIDPRFVEIKCVLCPIDLTSKNKDLAISYLNFLKRVYKLDISTKSFISTYFK